MLLIESKLQNPETPSVSENGEGLRGREGLSLTSPPRILTRDLQVNMADEVERNRLVVEFSGVTDVDAERAQFYLESAGWDLHVSILL